MAQLKSFLLQGGETREGIDILLSFTSMDSRNMKSALVYHLVDGANISATCAAYAISKSNFNRDLGKLNKIAKDIDRYFELNYKKSAK